MGESASVRRADPAGHCPACRAVALRNWSEKGGYRLDCCSKCGSISAARRESRPEPLYDELYGRSSFEVPASVATSLRRTVASFETFRRTGRWLDLGFGEGALLRAAQDGGWASYGTEVSAPALAFGGRQGWVVSSDPESDDRFPHEGFDVVSLVEVIEHLPEPLPFLEAARRWVRPGGALYITTPNVRSLNRWLLGAGWSVFCPPDHLVLWTPRALGAAVARTGFTSVSGRTEGLNPAEILLRLRRKRGAAPELNRNAAALALNQTLSASSSRRAIKGIANALLRLTRLGDTLKLQAVRPTAGGGQE